MLKINRHEYLEEEKIECISIYDNSPLHILASKARKRGGREFREFRGRYGVKSIFIFQDGSVILAPYHVDTYLDRAKRDEYLVADPNRCLIRRTCIREVTTKPNAQQRRDIKEAKASGMFLNLAGSKPVKYFLFTESGRIYALRLIKETI